MSNNLEEEIRAVLSKMDKNESQDNAQTPPDDIQDIYVFVVRERDDEIVDNPQVVESTSAPVTTQKDSFLSAYIFVCFSLFLILSTLTFQLYSMFNPPIATITIIPKSQTLTLSGTLQLGRLLQPITISQTSTTLTTGKTHQDARNATGTITFYNGQLNSIFVPAGLILTGSDGEQIVTDQDASIPASNLPQVGQVTVSAHATSPGSKGNIAAYDINQGCCATAIKAVNTNSFYGGQDQRDYQTVTRSDITNAAAPLKATLAQSMTGALEGQLTTNEQLQILPCSPTVTPNHQVGDEAIQVKVTVSSTCSGIAYNSQELENKATALLTSKAQSKFSGYSLFDGVTVKTFQANITHNLVFLSFSATGKWIYGLSRQSQEYIKKLIAGKPKDQALKLIASMPSIERASISWGDDAKLPKNSRYIHFVILIISV